MLLIAVVYVFDEDDCSGVPPEGALYQSMLSPTPGVAFTVIAPGPHLAASVPNGAAGLLFTVIFVFALTGVLQPLGANVIEEIAILVVPASGNNPAPVVKVPVPGLPAVKLSVAV